MKLSTPKLSGKAARMAEDTTTISRLSELAKDDVKPDEFGDMRQIPLDAIRPDPDQPRRLQITMEMLRNPENVRVPETRLHIESILGLAATIQKSGQQTSIEVYREGSMYRVVAGERRYWAARVAGLPDLHAKVLPTKPERLRLKQYLENASREDLTPVETLTALEQVVGEAARVNDPIGNLKAFQTQTGLPKTSAARWWAVLRAPADVRKSFESGVLTTLASAYQAAQEPDTAVRQALVERLAQAEREGRTTQVIAAQRQAKTAPAVPGAKQRKAGRGRPKVISFGGTTKPAVAKAIIEKVLGKAPRGVDWNDHKAIAKAFKQMLADLEASFAGS